MSRRFALLLVAALLPLSTASARTAAPVLSQAHNEALQRAVAGAARTPANVARDRFRHPAQTLSFFGVRPSDTVVEIFPGGGWYTEILAPYVLQGGGTYTAAAPDRGLASVRAMQQANPQLYGAARLATFPVRGAGETGVPAGTVDVVLTFRNVHNWLMGDKPYADVAFQQMFALLKPGGTLGIVDHRLPESADSSREKNSGYLKTSTVRRLAEQAGFQFVGASEVNANPRDTADHPEGVWTLPPTLKLGDKDRAKYLAIGESDRMTLRFIKPLAAGQAKPEPGQR
jgi:predicted methyltransferase